MTGIKLSLHWTQLELRDHFSVVQGAPCATDPLTGKRVDPTGVRLSYLWGDGKWHLTEVVIRGPVVAEDGSYLDDVECSFYDPVHGDEGSGKAPDWALEIAAKRMPLLPTPPAF